MAQYTQKGEEVVVDAIEAGIGVWVGWGTGTQALAKGNTALNTAASEARSSCAESQPAADKNQWVGTITCAGSGKTITEVGFFDASTSGNLIVYDTFAGVALSVGDAIQFTGTLEQT
jgi:hypothetical protein